MLKKKIDWYIAEIDRLNARVKELEESRNQVPSPPRQARTPEQEARVLKTWDAMVDLWDVIMATKPGNGSEEDRIYAIVRTQMQSLMGTFHLWVLRQGTGEEKK